MPLIYQKNHFACLQNATLVGDGPGVYRQFVFAGFNVTNTVVRKKDEDMSKDKEEARCLSLGCAVLYGIGKFQDSYEISKYVLTQFERFLKITSTEGTFPTFNDIIRIQCLQYITGCKTKPGKRMNKRLMDMLQMCNRRLDGIIKVDVIDLKAIIKTYTTVFATLFELDDLSKASIVGGRAFQIIKIVDGKKELAKVVTILCLTYYYQGSILKCFEMLSQLLDAAQQTGNIFGEAVYYSIIVKALRRLDNPEIRLDKMRMCNEFVKTKNPDMLSSKHKNQKYWVTSLLALWCSEQGLEDRFALWHKSALLLKEKCLLNNYWSISSNLTMIIIFLNRAREEVYNYTTKQVGELIDAVNKEISDMEDSVLQYAPIVRSKVKDTKALAQTIYVENTDVNV